MLLGPYSCFLPFFYHPESPWGRSPFDYSVVIFGNLILFVATTISFALYSKSLRNNRPPIFCMVYGAILAKMMICLVTHIFIKDCRR
jgi:hypothetical protein